METLSCHDDPTYSCSVDSIGTSLPQPRPIHGDGEGLEASQRFRYLRHEEIEPAFFPGSALPEGTLCWVLMSKGKNKSPQLYERARVLPASPTPGLDGCGGAENANDASGPPSDDAKERRDGPDDRVPVRYPFGSTYRVRRSNLVPVLEEARGLVLVAAETVDYRRVAVVHTRPSDHFLEVGCDFGTLVDSVDALTSLGVDKSEESVGIARERYPQRDFLLGDVFEDSDLGRIHGIMATRQPLVVAIDINGNRELPAVLKCIQLVMDSWSPRLVVVKSRELHAKLMQESDVNSNDAA